MFDTSLLRWSPEALPCVIREDRIEITTRPETDLWQRTFADFSCDNAPVLQTVIAEKCFVFTVKAAFEGRERYDQCGIVVHPDSDTWLKASIEREDDRISHLGSVVTNHGYSDWACTAVDASEKEMWYRLTRKGSDFLLETSRDGEHFDILRMCHMWNCGEEIPFGVYACSPGASSFTAVFSQLDMHPVDAAELAE